MDVGLIHQARYHRSTLNVNHEAVMKKIVGFMTALFIATTAGFSWGAAPVVVMMKASVAAASGVIVAPYSVSGGAWTPTEGAVMTFGSLRYDGTNKIWTAPNYFVVDISNNNGVGSPNVTVQYAENSKPAGQNHGLGWKAGIAFQKVTYPDVAVPCPGHEQRKPLHALDGVVESISSAQLSGGNLRLYVGLSDGTSNTAGEPFTNADMPGDYTGTLTITAVPG
jgi:hypothetical protein